VQWLGDGLAINKSPAGLRSAEHSGRYSAQVVHTLASVDK